MVRVLVVDFGGQAWVVRAVRMPMVPCWGTVLGSCLPLCFRVE